MPYKFIDDEEVVESKYQFVDEKQVEPLTSPTLPPWAQQGLQTAAGPIIGTGLALGQSKAMARPILEMGGAMGGGALGSLAGPVGTFAGETAGYAGGKQLANVLEAARGQRKPYSLADLNTLPQDLGEGVVLGGIGRVAAPVLGLAIKGAANIAPRLYKTILKPQTALSRKAAEKIVQTGLKEGIPITEQGAQKLDDLISGINKQMEDVIKQGPQEKVRIGALLEPVEKLIETYKGRADVSKDAIQGLKKYMQNMRSEHGLTISLERANEMKKYIYKQLNEHYRAFGKGQISKMSDEVAEGRKKVASGVMQELRRQFPILESLGPKDKALIDLSEQLNRAVGRLSNREVGGLALDILGGTAGATAGTIEGKDVAGGGVGAALGFLGARALRNPALMSRLAIALSKATKLSPAIGGILKPGVIPKALGYVGAKIAAPFVAQNIEALDPAKQAAASEDFATPINPINNPAFGAINANQPIGPTSTNIPTVPMESGTDPFTIMRQNFQEAKKQQILDEETKNTMVPEAIVGNSKTAQEGTQAYLAGDYKKALENFKKAIKEDPTRTNQYITAINQILTEQVTMPQKGKSNLSNSSYTAEAAMSKLSPKEKKDNLEKTGFFKVKSAQLAVSAYQFGDYNNAIKLFKKAIEENPKLQPQYTKAIQQAIVEKDNLGEYKSRHVYDMNKANRLLDNLFTTRDEE